MAGHADGVIDECSTIQLLVGSCPATQCCTTCMSALTTCISIIFAACATADAAADLTAFHMLQRALNHWTGGQKRELPRFYSGTEDVGALTSNMRSMTDR